MPSFFMKDIEQKRLSPEESQERVLEIYQELQRRSEHLREGNFKAFQPKDLEILFELYDARFFDGQCQRHVDPAPLLFRLSKRMTKTGGKTTRREQRDRHGGVVYREYEIAVSATLLFQAFQEGQRPITVSGLPCRDRLEALQRIFEHELVHLIEMVLWRDSSCSAPRFQSIANRYFRHTEHTHQLITAEEKAWEKGLQVGQRVEFTFEGRRKVGWINRITRRVTVLVEDPRGQSYDDGKRYLKYYVPLGMLKRVK